eukprot:TRINITY_DN5095_c0_g1_i1.p1 TRINITY_DN5095_c0_g1~~TRINITY_DN5095_c0_g1_i1.p1  ORF type:complete len:234 (+),score=42.35 TRINITY_DN5095_c0_g1_i1:175-876(+)
MDYQQLSEELARAKVTLAVQEAEIHQLRRERAALLEELSDPSTRHARRREPTKPLVRRSVPGTATCGPNVARVLSRPRHVASSPDSDYDEAHGSLSDDQKDAPVTTPEPATVLLGSEDSESELEDEEEAVDLSVARPAPSRPTLVPRLALNKVVREVTLVPGHLSRRRERNPGIPRSLGREFFKYKRGCERDYADECAELDDIGSFFETQGRGQGWAGEERMWPKGAGETWAR